MKIMQRPIGIDSTRGVQEDPVCISPIFRRSKPSSPSRIGLRECSETTHSSCRWEAGRAPSTPLLAPHPSRLPSRVERADALRQEFPRPRPASPHLA